MALQPGEVPNALDEIGALRVMDDPLGRSLLEVGKVTMTWKPIYEHLEALWITGRDCFSRGDYPLAAFFGSCLLEEVGALLSAGRSQFWPTVQRTADHRRKIYNGIVRALINNSRVTAAHRHAPITLAHWLQKGTFERIRRDALYLSVSKKGTVVSNRNRVTREEAYLVLSLGVEALLDPQGDALPIGPHTLRLEAEADAFRNTYGPQRALQK